MSLKEWFTKQKIDHLWNENVAENEETLLFLASEKLWNDISEICQNDFNIPKIKIAYLKAYLIKRTKATVTPTIEKQTENDDEPKAVESKKKTVQSTPKQDKNEKNKSLKKKNRKRNANKQKEKKIIKQPQQQKTPKKAPIETKKKKHSKVEESVIIINRIPKTPKNATFKLPKITKPEFKTNYLKNGLKYKDIQCISNENKDFMQLFKDKNCLILKGYDHFFNAFDIATMVEKYQNIQFSVKQSKSRVFRSYDLNRNFGEYDFEKPDEIKEMNLQQFINCVSSQNHHNNNNNDEMCYYYLQNSLISNSEIMSKMSDFFEIARLCEWGCLMSIDLMIGNKATQIPLHCEEGETLWIQLNGYAEIILFEPKTALNLYPFPYGHPCSNKQSMVNLEFMQKNATIFEKFQVENRAFDGTVYRGVLEKGDVCYIPSLWWYEVTNLNDFCANVKFLSKSSKIGSKGKLDIAQVVNEKTMEQKIAIGRNLERIVMSKYGSNGNITHKIFESFLSEHEDVQYAKQRNDIRTILKNVFCENEEINAFIVDLVVGRYNVDCSQFVVC